MKIHSDLFLSNSHLDILHLIEYYFIGICQHCLIINLPGSPKACRESIPVLASILPHAISVLNEDKKQVKHTHTSMQDDQK